VTIAEIALGRGLEFGIDWAAVNRGGDVNVRFGSPEIPDSSSGNLFLRLVYLAGLCALAALGAVAHGTEGESRRRTARWVIAAAVVTAGLLVLTVVTGPESFYVEDPTWPLR